MLEYDVIIVGACTSGTYFSNLLALEGLKVLVIDKDKEEDLSKRLDIIHFTRDSYKDFNVEEAKEGDEDFVHNFTLVLSKSGTNEHPKRETIDVDVLHLPLFIKKLRKVAISNGVEFKFNESFDSLIYENNRIKGIKTKEGKEYKSRLVVDASGIPSVIRRSIKDDYIENFEIGPKDKFYVLLKYVKLKDESVKITHSTSWPFYKGWIAPQHNKDGAIIGVGASNSFEYARKCMDYFEKNIPLPEYELEYEELGCTPYRRPPFSFVTDGFMVIGDAACLTKPFNGEGIPSSWVQCTPASKIIKEALSDDNYPTKERLWEINTLYQRNEGALFANQRAMLIGAVQMSKEDNDFLFRNRIVFKDDEEEENNKVISTLIKGVIKKEFSFYGFKNLVKGFINGSKLEKLYKKYPENPIDYFNWKKKADKLWNKVGTMADTAIDL